MAKRALIVLSAVVASLATAAPALAAPPPDRSLTATPAAPATWTGPPFTAANTQFDPSTAEPCGKTAADYCDTTLVNVVPGDFYSAPGRGIEFRTRQAQDVDLWVYESDASGTLGDLVGASAGATGNEGVSLLGGEGYFLVVVNYFAMTNVGYEGSAEFFRRNVDPVRHRRPARPAGHARVRPERGLALALRDAHRAEPDRSRRCSLQRRSSTTATPTRCPSTTSRSAHTRRSTGPRVGPTSARSTRARGSRRRRPCGRSGTRATRRTIRRSAATSPRTRATRRATGTTARTTSPPTRGSTWTTRATRTRWCSTRRRSRTATAGA